MAFTEPTVPSASQSVLSTVRAGDYTDTHPTLHGRLLTGAIENVRAHGPTVDGSTDNTDAFVKAINNLHARTPLGGGKLYVPGGLYRVNGDTIMGLLSGIQGWEIIGDGQLSTTIAATAGSSMGFGWNNAVNCRVRGISFAGVSKGDGRDGFLSYGNSRSNMFDNCRFLNGTYGFRCLADPGAPIEDQNERFVFLNCAADECTTGYRLNSNNSQGALFLGGGSSGCGTAFWGSTGWAEFHSWFCSSAGGVGTAWKTDSGYIQTSLYSCLDEAFATSFDLGNGLLLMENTYLQGQTKVISATGAAHIDASYCHFNDGQFAVGANSIFWDRENVFNGGVTFAVGANAVRHKFATDGYYIYFNDWTAHRVFHSAQGYSDYKQIAKPAAPGAGYNRLYAVNSSGKLTNQDSAGTESALY